MFRHILLLCLLLASYPVSAHPPPSFMVTADAPYEPDELPQLAELFRLAGDVTFNAHLGDLKSGIDSCEDGYLAPVRDLFASQQTPVVFSPGDNDWTDCQRLVAGNFSPEERLERLRRVMFRDPSVLRLDKLRIRRPPELAERYPELFWFRYGHVLFINWHIVGSNNNRLPDEPAALAEYMDRMAANTQLTEAALKGYKGYLRAVVVMTHGGLKLAEKLPPRGFRRAHRMIEELLSRTRAPVLVIHGDEHVYKQDQPWIGRPDGERLWRLMLPGHPHVAGVRVTFARDKTKPFVFTYIDSRTPPATAAERIRRARRHRG